MTAVAAERGGEIAGLPGGPGRWNGRPAGLGFHEVSEYIEEEDGTSKKAGQGCVCA